MISHNSRGKNQIWHSSALSTWIHFSVHCRRFNRNYSLQLLSRCSAPRYLLCCRPLPLRPINRSCIWAFRRFYPLIPRIYRIMPTPPVNQNPFLPNIHWCKRNLFPATFFRSRRHTAAILWLPRHIHTMKRYFLFRFYRFFCCNLIFYFYFMRSFYCPTAFYLSFN